MDNTLKIKILQSIIIVIIIAFSINTSADPTSEAYKKALESGDSNEIYRTQSFLAPPYCYDINLWHGIKFIKAVNGRVVQPSFPFTYQDMNHLKVRKLYDRAGIREMERASASELELIRHISDWANKQWGHMQPLPYASWDAHEILDSIEKGDAFWCTYKAALFVQACNAAGLTARMLGINRKDRDAHTVTEVYSNEFRKWMLVDPWMNCYFEHDSIPLSAWEVHEAISDTQGIFLVYGENGRGTEYWDVKSGKATTIPHAGKRIPIEKDQSSGLFEYYYDIRIVLRNDHTVHPQPKENIYIDSFMVPYNARGGEWWGPQLHWADDTTPPLITSANTGEMNDFEWPLNEVNVDLKKISVPGEEPVLETSLSTFTPNFSHYLLEVNGKRVDIDGDVYIWKLRDGMNSLKVASVNVLGRRGFSSEFVIEYDPSLIDYSGSVNVKLENPGFEEFDEQNRPLKWRTITSNPYRFRDFQIDPGVKHSGKYALKATPARDRETGVEYTFIVRTNTFDVNPASDVIYSVWLRASEENTAVDIALLEATSKGQGTYVKCVSVGKSWEKFELKCRLTNEINKAYVGFKVYTGTVWADDVLYEEINR